MSEISENQHYACYYPYTGRITGQTTNLKYWIQVPDETLVGTRPSDGWPLVIQLPGSGYYNPDGATTIIESSPSNTSGNYYNYPAVRILPKIDDTYYFEWACVPSNHITVLPSVASVAAVLTDERFHALRAVIDRLLNQTTIFYKEPALDSTWSTPTDFALPVINPDRIYLNSYSFGASFLIRVLQVFHNYLAAAFSGGYSIFESYTTPYPNDYQKRLIEASLHIGVMFYGGEFDGNLFSSLTTGNAYDTKSFYDAAAAKHDIDNRWYYCKLTNGYHFAPTPTNWEANKNYSFGKAVVYNEQNYICIVAHTSSAENAPPNTEYWRGPVASFPLGSSAFGSNLRFDPDNHNVQTLSPTGTKIKDWLFAQRRQTPLALDFSVDEVREDDAIYYPLGIDINKVFDSGPFRHYYKFENILPVGFGTCRLNNIGDEAAITEKIKLRYDADGLKKVYPDSSAERAKLNLPLGSGSRKVKVIKV